MYVAFSSVCGRRRRATKWAWLSAGGWVGRATMLRQGHCKRNRSCTGGQRHGKVLNFKKIVHICAIFARFLCEWELHANANETCEYARKFNNFLQI